MSTSDKKWYVMRDLRRRNSNLLAIHELQQAGLEAFTPMMHIVMNIGGTKQRRLMPVIQDLLFVHESKDTLDAYVRKIASLQYIFIRGKGPQNPMTVNEQEMNKFILAVSQSKKTLIYQPGELTSSMYGKTVRIIGGVLDKFEGHLLSVKGMRKRRLIVEIPSLITATVEVEPEFIEFV